MPYGMPSPRDQRYKFCMKSGDFAESEKASRGEAFCSMNYSLSETAFARYLLALPL